MRPLSYFRALWNTLTSPLYYIDILNAPLNFSVRFFLLSYFLLAVIGIGVFWTLFLPQYQKDISRSFTELQENFPSDLRLTWDGQQLQANSPNPIEVHYPSFFHWDALPASLGYINVHTSDPKQFSEQLPKKSMFVVTQDTLFINQNESGWSPLPLQEAPGFQQPFILDKASLSEFIPQWENFLTTTLRIVSVILPLFFMAILVPVRLVSILLEVILLFYVFQVMGKKFPFGKVYQLALHVLVVSEIVHLFSTFIIKTDLPMFEITFWAYFSIIILQLWKVVRLPIKAQHQ
jgi:hypothetical protein